MCQHFWLNFSFCGLSTGTLLRVFSRNTSMERIPSKNPSFTASTNEGLGKGGDYSLSQKYLSRHKQNLPWISFEKCTPREHSPYDSVSCTNLQEHTQCIEETQATGAEAQQSCPPAEGALPLIQATIAGLQIAHPLPNEKHARVRVRRKSPTPLSERTWATSRFGLYIEGSGESLKDTQR